MWGRGGEMAGMGRVGDGMEGERTEELVNV
jgi:hypothetical protein